MGRNGSAINSLEGQTFAGTFAFSLGSGKYTDLSAGVHKKAETLSTVHDKKKATWYQARDAGRH